MINLFDKLCPTFQPNKQTTQIQKIGVKKMALLKNIYKNKFLQIS